MSSPGERKWKTCMHRLRAWHQTDRELGDRLGVSPKTLQNVAAGKEKEFGDDIKEDIIELHDRIEKRPRLAGQACFRLLQVMGTIEEEVLTEEQIHVLGPRWERLQEQVREFYQDLTSEICDD